jgi:hypothetical protein
MARQVMHLGLPQWHYAFTEVGLGAPCLRLPAMSSRACSLAPPFRAPPPPCLRLALFPVLFRRAVAISGP